jgi:putative endonuclease
MSILKGKSAEKKAAYYLKTKGYQLIAQNFSCRMGEIDLIMLDCKTVIFVEVRQRKSALYGTAAQSITPQKRIKLLKTSALFLQMNTQYKNYDCRFDVVAFDGENDTMQWIPNAFGSQ